MVLVVRTPREDIPQWLKDLIALLVVLGLFSAIACLTTGLVAMIRAKRDKSVEHHAA